MKDKSVIPKLGMIVLILGIQIPVLGMSGCASQPERWLTAEEDAAFRAQCEDKNCVIVPGIICEQIKAALEKALGTPI